MAAGHLGLKVKWVVVAEGAKGLFGHSDQLAKDDKKPPPTEKGIIDGQGLGGNHQRKKNAGTSTAHSNKWPWSITSIERGQ